jgi:hypothetical protein
MTRRPITILFALPMLAMVAASSGAQAPATLHTLRGTVASQATDAPLGHSMITLLPIGRQTFTTDEGRFTFADVPPGSYRLRVTHLGYSPQEYRVMIAADAEPPAERVKLVAVSFQLGTMKVVAAATCVAPGPPNAAKDPDFAGIFQQLLENAEQYRLLADSFPYSFVEERSRNKRRGDDVVEPFGADTVLLRSDIPGWHYKAGDVVYNNIFTGKRAMHLPTLADFASKAFTSSHCFSYGGRDSTTDGNSVRIDFRVADRIKGTDVNGSMWLDASGYQIRRADLSLSKIPGWLRKIDAVKVTTIFGEIEPSVLVFSAVHAVNYYHPSKSLLDYVDDTEDHRILDFEWVRKSPRGDAKVQKP